MIQIINKVDKSGPNGWAWEAEIEDDGIVHTISGHGDWDGDEPFSPPSDEDIIEMYRDTIEEW